MAKRSIFWHTKQLRRSVFTTHELCAISGRSRSGTTQALSSLAREGIIFRISRGVWAESGNEKLSPYVVTGFLLPRHRSYVSFLSALHLYGFIEQIPQTMTLATTAHTKTVRTTIGTYAFHQIHPLFFDGFGWYKRTGSFLIARPEKALIDCLYLSTRKKRQFGHFPELHLPKSFSIRKAKMWIKKIPEPRIRACVKGKLKNLLAA